MSESSRECLPKDVHLKRLFTMLMYCCGDRDNDMRVNDVRSPAAAVDLVADSDVVKSFDIDDTPVTFRTRPTRAKLVSTLLRQRPISQNIATSRVPTRTPPAALSRYRMTGTPQCSADPAVSRTSGALSGLGPLQSTDQSSDVAASEEPPEHLSSSKLTSCRRSRSSITRTDALESPLSLSSSEFSLKTASHELQPIKVETTATLPLSTAASPVTSCVEVSPIKAALTVDSSAELNECKNDEAATTKISPITRNNHALLHQLKRPPSITAVQSDTVDMKKLRMSPPSDVKHPSTDGSAWSSVEGDESKAGHSLDQLSSSSPVTISCGSRQPLSVKIDASNTSSSCSNSTAISHALPAKSNVTSPRIVSHCLSIIITVTTRRVITSLPKVICEEGRVAALSHTYAVKSPLVTMVRPKFVPKSIPSRGPITKPHYLPHPWTRPTYGAKQHPDPIRRFSTMHWTDRPTDTPTDRSSRESLMTIARCVVL